MSSFKRDPDVVIGPKTNPYMERWYLIPRNPWFNVYLHKISRSDDARALHDHRSDNLSLILKGSYREIIARWDKKMKQPVFMRIGTLPEQLLTRERVLSPGNIVFRKAEIPHRLELIDGPIWTLWIKFRERRDWGFWPFSEHWKMYHWMHYQAYHKKYGDKEFV